jgi:hypothetical protein
MILIKIEITAPCSSKFLSENGGDIFTLTLYETHLKYWQPKFVVDVENKSVSLLGHVPPSQARTAGFGRNGQTAMVQYL